ncbi:hypothetical protein [Vibrio nigripulchritudo]|uniref:hypothetical protein n=1 Tax=Vibrio nigripulchritudo TaxID=28173 RepID=UPI0005FA0839|nr:hypothetical protein [Vibrio nigripulchritudo]KJY79529.1 hypothetical protein TW74_08745 [Vibrio nigripulchritudo]
MEKILSISDIALYVGLIFLVCAAINLFKGINFYNKTIDELDKKSLPLAIALPFLIFIRGAHNDIGESYRKLCLKHLGLFFLFGLFFCLIVLFADRTSGGDWSELNLMFKSQGNKEGV